MNALTKPLIRLFFLGGATMLSGCAVTGKWDLAAVEPTAARRDFKYEVLTLQKDGTFYAEAREPVTMTTSGTYRFEKGVLSLAEHNGARHTYDAQLLDGGQRLALKEPWQDRVLVASFERKTE
jgi:hypothetical protein